MLSARLIERLGLFGRLLLKYLSQVLKFLAKVTTSPAQRPCVLVVYFRRFVARIRSSSRSSIDPKSSESASESRAILTSTSSGWCSHSTSPSPSHTGQITSVSAANSSQPVVPPSSSPPITEQYIADRKSLHAQVNISNGSTIQVKFKPLRASNDLRYRDRPHAYVIAAHFHISG